MLENGVHRGYEQMKYYKSDCCGVETESHMLARSSSKTFFYTCPSCGLMCHVSGGEIIDPRKYDTTWDKIEMNDWPEPGQIYICRAFDYQTGNWAVGIMGDGTSEGDSVALGNFYRENDARRFAEMKFKLF